MFSLDCGVIKSVTEGKISALNLHIKHEWGFSIPQNRFLDQEKRQNEGCFDEQIREYSE